MAHPLEIKLSDLTDDELNDRISKLHARLKFMYMSGNMPVINQLQLFLDEAIIEQTMRSEKLMGSFDNRNKSDN